MRKIFIIFLFLLILPACSQKNIFSLDNTSNARPLINQAEYDLPLAKQSLNLFLTALSDEDYNLAVIYYGDDYNELIRLNPEIDSQAKADLLRKFCFNNNGVCLDFTIIDSAVMADDKYQFLVQFFNDKGQLYVKPGCACRGGGQTKFEFMVQKINDKFLVMNLPPKS